MYKSNSSLDLDHEVDILQESTVLTGAHSSGGQSRREYGSHGSLDMMGRGLTHGGEAVSGAALNGGMFAQPGDGPVAVSTLTRRGLCGTHTCQFLLLTRPTMCDTPEGPSSVSTGLPDTWAGEC